MSQFRPASRRRWMVITCAAKRIADVGNGVTEFELREMHGRLIAELDEMGCWIEFDVACRQVGKRPAPMAAAIAIVSSGR